jgi:hypothetical protein
LQNIYFIYFKEVCVVYGLRCTENLFLRTCVIVLNTKELSDADCTQISEYGHFILMVKQRLVCHMIMFTFMSCVHLPSRNVNEKL